MILFFLLASMMALSVAWLLFVPVVSAQVSRRNKQRTLFYVLIATILLPLTLYYFITF
jgi:hypothetical protein